jgi:competence protein ComEA
MSRWLRNLTTRSRGPGFDREPGVARRISSLTKEHAMFRWAIALAFAVASQLAAAAVNLNTATKEELIAVSGIGPARAQAIIDYRTQHGGFKSIDELKDVKGIGARRVDQLKTELTVTPVTAKTPARPDAKGQTVATKNDAKPQK